MKKKTAGFTLIEIIVVVGIIGILSAITYANFNEARAQARDAERQSDLRNLQSAIELYKNKYGRYPERCPVTSPAKPWSGQKGTDYECDSGNHYIVGLAPEFIPTLPTDPQLNGDDSGYVYAVDTDGTVYKLMAKNTVESEVVDKSHPFKSCDVTGNGSGVCDNTQNGPSFGHPTHCGIGDTRFQTSYAVWGGYPDESLAIPAVDGELAQERIICDIP